jgi:uncharacterized membrane protein YdjX (TVP38/TMEM64 family)
MKIHKKEILKLLASNLLRGLLGFFFLFVVFLLLRNFIPEDMVSYLEPLKERKILIYSIFLVSETIIGLIPPEVFMIWGLGDGLWSFIKVVSILGTLSYIGGIIAFYLGRILYNSKIMNHIKSIKTFNDYTNYYSKYGGILIFISAVTPLPFALFSFISGSLNYTFKRYMTYASFRFIRFAFYGYLIWEGASLTF